MHSFLNRIVFSILAVVLLSASGSSSVRASTVPDNGESVGTTYYGGHYSETDESWVIDNTDQCDRIDSGEFTAASLNAIKDPNCSDDNGLGYRDDIKLHNRVSFAELSDDASASDFSALGNLAQGTKLQIKYNNQCLIAEKLDVGTGGGAVNGTRRALDLWWQTARSINFTNGFDILDILIVDQTTPLTALGQTSVCIDSQQQEVEILLNPQPQPPAAGSSAAETPPIESEAEDEITKQIYQPEIEEVYQYAAPSSIDKGKQNSQNEDTSWLYYVLLPISSIISIYLFTRHRHSQHK